MADENAIQDEQTRDAMLSVNKRQKEFYETHGDNLNQVKTGFAIRIWGVTRGLMKDYRRSIGLKDAIRSFQLESLGDLTGKRVLDLGCYDGNSMSIHLAKSSQSYLGVDLSESAISTLNEKLSEFLNARGQAVDFL